MKVLNYDGIEFPVREKGFDKTEMKNNISINVFGYENRLVFQIFVSDKKSKDSIDLLLIVDGGKSHYVYIKNFDRFMFHKTKNKNKKYVCKSCLQCLSSKNVLAKHKEDCLSINDVQSRKVKKGTIEFENYFKQIPGPFKIYADFECSLKGVEIFEDSYSKKYQKYIPCSFAYKVACIDDRFNKPVVVLEVKMMLMNLLKQFLRIMSTVKK